MKIISITPLALPDVKVVTIQRFADERGYFTEVYQEQQFAEQGQLSPLHHKHIAQINESYSRAGVLRGLHTQSNPNLDKFLRVLHGSIVDIAVDIRPGSATYGSAVAYELSFNAEDTTEQAILIPYGFAHGFIAQSDAQVQYLQTGVWNQEGERCLNFADPDINWTTCETNLQTVIHSALTTGTRSEKDRQGLALADFAQ